MLIRVLVEYIAFLSMAGFELFALQIVTFFGGDSVYVQTQPCTQVLDMVKFQDLQNGLASKGCIHFRLYGDSSIGVSVCKGVLRFGHQMICLFLSMESCG